MKKILINIITFNLILFSLVSAKEARTLTLEESLEMALINSYNIKYAEQNLIREQENVKATRAALRSNASLKFFTPSFKTEYEQVYDSNEEVFKYKYSQKNRMMSQLTVNQPIRTNGNLSLNYDFFHETQLGDIRNYSNYLYFKFQQPIFTPNVLSMDIRRAELGLNSTELDYQNRKLSIEYSTTRSYYNLYRTLEQGEINEKRVQLLEEANEIVKNLNGEKLIEEMDVLQIEVELANSTDQLISIEGILERQKNSFKQSIGLPIAEDIKIVTNLKYTPIEMNDEFRKKTIDTGIKKSIRIRKNEISKEYRTMAVTDADRRNEFRGNIITTLGFDKKDSLFTETLKKPDQTRSITLELYMPLWDWGRNKAQVRSANASLSHSEIALEESLRDVKRRLEDELRNLKEASDRLKILENSKTLAEKSYYLGLEKFKNGEISSQDLLLVLDQHMESQNSFLNAFIDFQLAKALLKRMVSG